MLNKRSNLKSASSESHHWRGSSRRLTRLVTGAIGLITLSSSLGLASTTGVSAAAVAKAKACHSANGIRVTDRLTCKGLAFYKGKTLKVIVATAAGAGFDVDTRFVTPQLAAFLGVQVVVADYPAGASIPGQNALASSPADGLTIGLLNTGNDVINIALNIPSLNFNPAHEVFLGGWPTTTGLLIDHTNDPYTSFAALKNATTTSPVTICEITNNSTSIQLNLVLKAFGVNYRAIYGYTNSASEETGWNRGDCQLVYVSDAGLAPFVKQGIARALATTVAEPSTFVYAPQLVGVPLIRTLLTQATGQTALQKKAGKYALTALSVPGTTFAAPAGVKGNRFNALRAAMKFALHSQIVKNSLSNRGEDQGYVSPEAAKNAFLKALAQMGPAARLATQ